MLGGKYWFHRIFQKEPAIKGYLPSTAICTPSSLNTYLKKYSMVYIKPTGGGRGIGVIKAWRKRDQYFFVIEKGEKSSCDSVQKLYKKLKLASKKTHIVQQGIKLAKLNGRPFDIRLMMMRNKDGKWSHIGMVAKVAGRKSIITNVARGKGYVTTVDEAMKKSLGLGRNKIASLKKEMIQLAHDCNRVYSKHRYDWQIGYDIAVDKNSKVWLIEANPSNPAHFLFKKYKETYRKIRKLAKYHSKKKRK